VELRPILSAMRRNKFGALLIATQMAVTLAFLANAITLVEQRTAWSGRPSGIDERDIFILTSESVDHLTDAESREAADMAALRALPGVADAYTTNMYPMQGGGWIEDVTLTADQKTPSAITAHYMGDEHALNTMGVKLIAGRNPFQGATVVNLSPAVAEEVGLDPFGRSGVVVTKTAAGQAQQVGVQPGDIIRAVNGREIKQVQDLTNAVAAPARLWQLAPRSPDSQR